MAMSSMLGRIGLSGSGIMLWLPDTCAICEPLPKDSIKTPDHLGARSTLIPCRGRLLETPGVVIRINQGTMWPELTVDDSKPAVL